jgi:predicted membrane-bound spermidine synthase
MHVGVIAFAGVAANLRLVQLLRRLSGNAAVARRVLAAWLVGNLFLGSQLSWILRPFIGAPGLPVEFLRSTAFKGNFYETVAGSFLGLFGKP